MAAIYEFECQSCGHIAQVAGGSSSSFTCDLQTVHCLKCRDLTDIIVRYNQSNRFGYTDPIPEGDENYQNRCFYCKGSDFVNWSDGDPCPRCGGPMGKSEKPVLYGD